jgi:calcineurin-like phosphoesterase family protein
MYWFTADYHLSHRAIMQYCHRPFSSVQQMDDMILSNLDASIRPGDTLYFLGDLSFGLDGAKQFLDIIKNRKTNLVFIKGNHDKSQVLSYLKSNDILILALTTIYLNDHPVILCHYSMRVWDRSHFNSWQLYAHSHGTLPPEGKQHDVGVDANDFFPVSGTQIIEIMESRPDNFNYIKNRK